MKNNLSWLTPLGIAAGFILSVVAWLQLCTEECSAAHQYRFFGLPFEPIGIVFFFVLGFLWWKRRAYPWMSKAIVTLLLVALGSELVFIGVQKVQIQHWCPVCLSIAASIMLAFICYAIEYFIELNQSFTKRDPSMIKKNILQGTGSFLAVILGVVVALIGVSKPEEAFASDKSLKEDLGFGNKDSKAEVYVVTDWFCPACQALEPELEKMYPGIMAKARLYFIDFVIHPDSMNYIPYNLSFMTNDKEQYFKLRKVLHDLALTTRAPSEKQVQDLIAPIGVKYDPLNFVQIESGIRYFESTVKKFQINSTPTVVITNRSHSESEKLQGGREITEANILQAVDKFNK